MKKRKRKILFIMPSLGYGGTERVICTILNKLDRREFKLGLLILDSSYQDGSKELWKQRMADDIEIYRHVVRGRFRERLISILTYGKKIASQYDLVVSGYDLTPMLTPLLISMVARKKIISLIHLTYKNRVNIHDMQRKSRKMKRKVMEWIERRGLRLCRKLVAVSGGVKNDLVEICGISEEKVEVIYPPVSPHYIKEMSLVEDAETEKAFCDQPDYKYILNVSRLTFEKGLTNLLEVFSKVRKKNKVKLIILGSGELKRELELLIISLGISEDVVLLGYQNNPYKFMRKADLMVHTSLAESVGLVLIESMLCGTPVVARDCYCGPREFMQGGRGGKLVPINDSEGLKIAINEMFTNQDYYDECVRGGYETAKVFFEDEIIMKYERLLKDIDDETCQKE